MNRAQGSASFYVLVIPAVIAGVLAARLVTENIESDLIAVSISVLIVLAAAYGGRITIEWLLDRHLTAVRRRSEAGGETQPHPWLSDRDASLLWRAANVLIVVTLAILGMIFVAVRGPAEDFLWALVSALGAMAILAGCVHQLHQLRAEARSRREGRPDHHP